ncbi:MAG: hypothetical protein Q9182_005934 [Xanthomendoza sp. 2 TL-2023]
MSKDCRAVQVSQAFCNSYVPQSVLAQIGQQNPENPVRKTGDGLDLSSMKDTQICNWTPTTNGTVSLFLNAPSTSGSLAPIATIVSGIANTGTYTWTPYQASIGLCNIIPDAQTGVGSVYSVSIVPDSHPNQLNYWPQFAINGFDSPAEECSELQQTGVDTGASRITTDSAASTSAAVSGGSSNDGNENGNRDTGSKKETSTANTSTTTQQPATLTPPSQAPATITTSAPPSQPPAPPTPSTTKPPSTTPSPTPHPSPRIPITITLTILISLLLTTIAITIALILHRRHPPKTPPQPTIKHHELPTTHTPNPTSLRPMVLHGGELPGGWEVAEMDSRVREEGGEGCR